jgi:hypothetical protein
MCHERKWGDHGFGKAKPREGETTPALGSLSRECGEESPMSAKRVIDGVHMVPMGFANAFLIESDDGLTLIDAGFPRKEATVFAAIKDLAVRQTSSTI